MLTTVRGRFHPTLERAFRQHVADFQRLKPEAPIAVVAPSQHLVRRLKEIIADEGAFINISFSTLAQFAAEIKRESRNIAPISPPLVLRHLLQTLLKKYHDHFISLREAEH